MSKRGWQGTVSRVRWSTGYGLWKNTSVTTPKGQAACLLTVLWTFSIPAGAGKLPGTSSQSRGVAVDGAQQALDDQRFAEAEAAFRSRLLEDPASLAALEGWARALLGLGRGAEATGSLRRGSETALERADYARAVALLELALAASPGDMAVSARLGQALMLDRRFTAAEGYLRSAWEGGERGPRELLYFAACLWENGELEEAEARYREAIERTGGNAVALYELGRLLLWQGRAEEAAASIDRALARGASGLGPRLDLARALGQLAREGNLPAERAVQAFRAAVAMAPEHSEARYGLARALLLAGRREQAQEELATYGRLQSEDQVRARELARSAAQSARARELIGEGRSDEARALLEELPDLAEVWHARALLARLDGDIGGAIEALERALALERERADLAALLTELRTLE